MKKYKFKRENRLKIIIKLIILICLFATLIEGSIEQNEMKVNIMGTFDVRKNLTSSFFEWTEIKIK